MPPADVGTEPAAFLALDPDCGGARGAKVIDFWRWALSDLRMNTVRPMLAEFLVARALGDTQPRLEWANHDVTSAEGVRVEVKSSGYLQSWAQRAPSRILFGRLSGRAWDPETATMGSERVVRADVFVFAVQTCREPAAYDPLDVGQWEFFVMPARAAGARHPRTVSLTWVREGAGEALPWGELRDAVNRAAGR